MYTKNAIIGIHAEPTAGTMLNASPRPAATSFVFIASMPPTAFTANTARMITIDILMTNWNRSVTSTPQRPESVEIADVSDHAEHDDERLDLGDAEDQLED